MKQLTIYLENKVGTLSSLLSVVSDLNINVRSVITERMNISEVRLIVDDPEEASNALAEQNITAHLVDIVVVELDNKPGELVKVTKLLDDKKVNIDYIYGIDHTIKDKGLFAIKTELEYTQLAEILSSFNLH